MQLTDDELQELYQQQTARSVRGRTRCLTEEILMQAAAGELNQSERERVADHLMTCSDCAEEYRLVRSLKPWAEQVAASAGESGEKPGVTPTWPTIQQREETTGFSEPRRRRVAFVLSSRRVPYALAASLVIVSLALGAWIASLRQGNQRLAARLNEQISQQNQSIAAATESLNQARRQLEEATRRAAQYETEIAELSQPQLNAPIIDLDPRDSLRSGTRGNLRTIELPSSANVFTLVLNVVGQPSFDNYALEILDLRGHSIWQGQGLRKSPYNTFTLTLPRRLLPAGQYRLKLYGLRGDRKELVQEYAMRVQYQ
jgi:hypothetical protein